MTSTDNLKSVIASLTKEVSTLNIDDPSAYAKMRAIINNLNMLLSQTNETRSVLLALGIVSVVAGSSVPIPITIIPGTFPLVGLQCDILFNSDLFVFNSLSAGQVATVAQKSVQSALISGGITLLVFGINQTVMGAGTLATLSLKVAATAKKGIYPIMALNSVASDPAGSSIPFCVTSGIVTIS